MPASRRSSRDVRDLALAVRRQKRIVALFAVTILAPAAALGFFGLRALQADRFRIEELLRREREGVLRSAEARLQAGLFDLLEGLRRKDRTDVPGTLLRVTEAGEFCFLREWYCIREQDRDPSLVAGNPEVLEAERLEHRSGDLAGAAERYGALARDDDPCLRGLGLLGLARVSIRRGKTSEALLHYRRLLSEIPEELERDTAAHALMAALQIANLDEKSSSDLLAAYFGDATDQVGERNPEGDERAGKPQNLPERSSCRFGYRPVGAAP